MLKLLLIAFAFAAQDEKPAGVQWYATWEQAKAEAKKLDRPIFLFSAAPQCHGVSGLW